MFIWKGGGKRIILLQDPEFLTSRPSDFEDYNIRTLHKNPVRISHIEHSFFSPRYKDKLENAEWGNNDFVAKIIAQHIHTNTLWLKYNDFSVNTGSTYIRQ
jgi:hypothetical protein